MARIRIVDAWLRSPASAVNNQRSVMVVAEKWAEQRVLMRAFANSADQTRPTIFLHGSQLAIGPAGVDASGSWGIHVEPPIDGRAQELRAQLELAARRLAGSKGNPPRLMDEAPSFDGKATQHWAPGTPPDLPSAGGQPAAGSYYEPSESAHVPTAEGTNYVPPDDVPPNDVPLSNPGPPPAAPPGPSVAPGGYGYGPPPAAPPRSVATPGGPGYGPPPAAPEPYHNPPANPPTNQSRGWSSPLASSPPLRDRQAVWPSSRAGGQGPGARTQRGFAVGPSAAAPPRRQVDAPSARLSGLIRKTMPPGFQLSAAEREVLNALDKHPYLTVSQVEHLTHAADAIVWMHRFMEKLAHYGLDVVTYGTYIRGQPTYRLSTAPHK